MKNKVVIISAHPDDEVLGAGGTLLKHKAAGDKILWLIVTNIFEKDGFDQKKVQSRQEEINEVAQKLGVEKVVKFDYSTMKLTSKDVLSLIPKISEEFRKFEPEVLYCLNRSDAHSDHRIITDAVMACTKSFRYPHLKRILMYECLSETEFAPAFFEKVFLPNYFVDISDFLEEKLNIMKIYSSELGEHPFPRSIDNIKALACHRGAIAGVQYAEAFQLVKYIDK